MERNDVKTRIGLANKIETGLLTVEAARNHIIGAVRPIEETETLPVRSALGRVLAMPVVSSINVPSHTNSAVDGFALRGDDLPASGSAEFRLAGSIYAGQTFDGSVQPGECVRIMTGAPMPAGADSVVMQEDAEADADRVTIRAGHKRGQNVRPAGEDLAKGQTALEAGKRVGPAELGLLASIGNPEVCVKRRLRVAFFSTGDELRSIGETLGEGEIYDSNRYSLHGMLTRLGVDILDLGVVPDRREAIGAAFRKAAGEADMVITSGGVSVGEADYVKEVLDEMGVVSFWKIAMKPGRPLAFGAIGDTCFFGLPGNPVAVMVTFYQFVQPAIRRMMGDTQTTPSLFKVPCLTPLRKRPGRTEFQRGVLSKQEDGTLAVGVTGKQGSGIMSSMCHADCFIILGHGQGNVKAGELVDVEPFFSLV